MAITLVPETEHLIEEKLKQLGYASADQLIQMSLETLTVAQLELDEETLDAIDEAEDAIERGEVYRLDDVKDEILAMFDQASL